jgi:glutamate formiminotransferase/formiminotetrahydrofolate cyclodeaminase
MSLLGLAVRDLLARFASADPTPGGGSAAALAGATGAALVSMVCAMAKTRGGLPADRERLDTALGWAREARERLERLVDEDTAAYDAVVAAYRLPKGTEEEKAARRVAVGSAMERATQVPMDTAEACLVVLQAAGEAAAHGNPNAVSDARTGAALALAGLLGAVENVRINASGRDGAVPLLERADSFVREGRERAAAAGLPF